MKKIICAIIILAANTVLASDETVLLCKPNRESNGLHIGTMLIHISNEDPDATMEIKFENAKKTQTANMSYEGDDQNLQLIPYSKHDSEIRVTLKKLSGQKNWIAFVSHESLDTFSKLSCKQLH
jgi:hypothetical protein